MSNDLTPREVEILKMFADGAQWKQVMAECHITHATLRDHLRNINEKLGAVNKTNAVAIAKDRRLI
jgi:LuxR family maltose regulon positive regulatory protein